MTDWSPDDLERIGTAAEIHVAPSSPDGTPRRSTTIWVVRVGDDLYVRSYRGADGHWYQRAREQHQGRIRAGGVERDVTFVDAGGADQAAISDAYRRKYASAGAAYVDPMVSPDVAATTLRLAPR
jgi:hypothetical protein